MQPHEIKFWYFTSFLLPNVEIAKIQAAILERTSDAPVISGASRPRLRLLDIYGFSPYISFEPDELLVELSDDGTPSREIAISNLAADSAAILVTASIKLYFEANGRCSSILELAPTAPDQVNFRELVSLSNIFELEHVSITMRDLSGREILSSCPLTRFFDYFVKQLEQELANIGCPILGESTPAPGALPGLPTTPNSYAMCAPYVVALLGYRDADSFEKYILKRIECNPEDREAKKLAALLYRFKTPDQWEKVDMSYVRRFSSARGTGIENHHLHESIFITTHLRSTLVAYDMSMECSGTPQRLLDIYLPPLQLTIANAIATWYGFVQLNHVIDDRMQDFRLTDSIASDPAAVLAVLIGLRKQLMGLLNSSVAYKRSSGTLAELHSNLMRIFEIKALREDSLAKVDTMERLYSNLQQYNFLSTLHKSD